MNINWRQLLLVAIAASVFGAGFGYLGGNFEKSWITGGPDDEYSHYTQYLIYLHLDATGGGPVGSYQRSAYAPYARLYRLEQTFSPVTGVKPGSFGQYLANQSAEIDAVYARAGAILTSLYAADQRKRDTVEEEALSDLLELALRPYFGAHGTQSFVETLPNQQTRFELQQARGTATTPTFLGFIFEMFDLGKFFDVTRP